MARRGAGIRPGAAHLAPAELERARRIHRVQLRRALGALGLLGTLIVGLPLLLAVAPGLDEVRLVGVPVSWLAVGALPYVVLVVLAGWQLRRAERAERQPVPPTC